MPKMSPAAYDARRAHIMAAARRCFTRHGIHVSVDEICVEAGVSKGALYVYFPSKQRIIEAIAEEHGLDIEAVRRAPTIEALKATLIESFNHGDPKQCRLELEAWTHSLTNPGLGNRLRGNRRHLKSAIVDALTGMQERGEIELAVPPAIAATIIMTYAFGVIASSAMSSKARAADTDFAFGELVAMLCATPAA